MVKTGVQTCALPISIIKTTPEKKKYKNAKWLSDKALQIAEKREAKGKGEKE